MRKKSITKMHIQLYEAGWQELSWSYPQTPENNGHDGSIVDDPEIIDLQSPLRRHPFPLENYPRSDTGSFVERHYAWRGELAPGAWVEQGTYVPRVAALRPFGDPDLSEDWDIWGTSEITITLAE